ncbi:hypothetical protein HNQ94_000986 [Salirhabdus euzebyi]|uniref:Threonine dehydratase n=1 Tax=Salirhabdus euzebyi TaxID=394506 RepID=A0A841PZ54_9BACI|nr:hypothetical protein [Salirhabdus euzebyi]MBB6452541.1 hypothetical protein [Salirhabdus euzebyi]
MEFILQSKDGAFPCEITMDEDNGRYMIRKADTSGEVFNTPSELVEWVQQNWVSYDFVDQEQYKDMLKAFHSYLSESSY